ncbi:FYVE zinc finger-domain-containing protein [Lipomyces oligophaga]|uniref:FYVE zinc finger-domain-containing protein n=1 Tax=Lipomyces oligophaga TaxID=45792 RepID=UPI0034CE7DE7
MAPPSSTYTLPARDLMNQSPVPSLASSISPASLQPSVVVESLKSKKHGHQVGSHRPRRVIGADNFQLPPVVADDNRPTNVLDSELLICPICSESLGSDALMAQHLEEVHRESDNIQSKFMKYLHKAKNLPPVQALNSTFQYADLSDLSFTVPLDGGLGLSPSPPMNFAGPSSSGSTGGVTFVGSHNLAPSTGTRKTRDYSNAEAPVAVSKPHAAHKHQVHHKPHLTEEMITRSHWQRETPNDKCSEYRCRIPLNNRTGKVHCRSCGRIFCEEHVPAQMKLDKKANWDPQQGAWCRVCYSCFESRPGYNDATGNVDDLTESFVAKRKSTITKTHLEVNLLENRLSRLLKLMIETDDPSVFHTSSMAITTDAGAKALAYDTAGVAASLASGYFKQIRNYRKPPEQAIVAWQEDSSVIDCPYCERRFTFAMRKHHCRLCGKLVCASQDSGCSTIVTLDSTALADYLTTEKLDDDIQVKVRVCRDCHSVVFGHREFAEDVQSKPAIVKVYGNMMQFKRSIELMLPKFQKMLSGFDDPDHPPSHEQMAEAGQVRKKLLHGFQEYDAAAKRIYKMPTSSEQQSRIQANIHMAAMQVLQMYMLPLKSLPSALKHHTQHPKAPIPAIPTTITKMSDLGGLPSTSVSGESSAGSDSDLTGVPLLR